jgi:hypothetical protein
MSSIEQELRKEIKKALAKCNPLITPKVCERIKTLDGYRYIEDIVIHMVIRDTITPGGAIAQIEMELP